LGTIDPAERWVNKDLRVDRNRDDEGGKAMRGVRALHLVSPSLEFRQILGIRFFVGGVQRAIELVKDGGLLVVPAAPALKNLVKDPNYREALLEADVAITDSALMVMLWNFIQRDNIRRLSGLEYLAALLIRSDVRKSGKSFWIMASSSSAATNLEWLQGQGIEVSDEDVYVAPMYGPTIDDEPLLAQIRKRRPSHIIVTIGGGSQERVGLYLKRRLDPLPAIHCIGAAIAFLSGDQVQIPMWADRLYLGWLFRCLSEPRRYVPRYWSARKLVWLMLQYRETLPLEKIKEAA
jgi:UDP-N-acetyl-D-mannosaminuronic acid transferase (WecB/TagA/CpsF family)